MPLWLPCLETKAAPNDLDSKAMDFTIDTKALGNAGEFEAYASAFGVVDSYNDTVEKGAFVKSLREHKKNDTMPALLWQHNHDEPCGRILEAKEDNFGLLIKGQFNLETEKGKDAYAHVKAGDVKTLSIGYRVRKYELSEQPKQDPIRRLLEVELWECSIVTFAANTQARVQAVKNNGLMSVRDFEAFLCERFTRKQAQTIIAKGYKPLVDEDSEGDAMRDAGDTDEKGVTMTPDEVKALSDQAAFIQTLFCMHP